MKSYDKNLIHYVVVTGILVKDGKFLIVKRADWEKAFPGRWTVPGGKLEVLDYSLKQKDTPHHWYNVFENLLRKEVEEEIGAKIKNIGYVTSMIYVRPDNVPCIIVSLWAEPLDEKICLCNALSDFAWVTLEESKKYDLIEGMYEELFILDKKLKGEGSFEWKKE
ncbi:Nucleoside triphosphatase NudI [uncultured archaeon]|nr:Nucleoside triphosphatase NudI [uncultured archaeon]